MVEFGRHTGLKILRFFLKLCQFKSGLGHHVFSVPISAMRFIDFLLCHYELIRKFEVPRLSSVCVHSDQVKKDSLFIAMKGRTSDGHNYLQPAMEKGAVAFLVKKTDLVPSDFKGAVLKYNGSPALSRILKEFYNFPSEKLFTVGVTGTNGKTSFCYLLEQIFKHCGWPSAVIGTVDQHFNERRWPAALTTPDPVDLFDRLNDFVHWGARAVVMELSSHALDQNRVEGINFNALVFTNFSQDHLDYHGTMEKYFQAKRKLFIQANHSRNKNLFCLLNQDDEQGINLKQLIQKPCYTYGQSPTADFCFQITSRSDLHSVFKLKSPSGVDEFALPLTGDYNVYNAVSALACAMLTGFKPEDCAQALKKFSGVPGRLQKVETSKKLPFEIIVDYAHTPSALASVLSVLKTCKKKIILVFGCGGDRDKEKRPQMASVALKWADKVFLTSDNPRFEDPQQIAGEALQNLPEEEKANITVELDRKEAIKQAIQFANEGDCVLIAGKGHERFQIVQGERIPFCDNRAALECLKELGLN